MSNEPFSAFQFEARVQQLQFKVHTRYFHIVDFKDHTLILYMDTAITIRFFSLSLLMNYYSFVF